MQRNSISIFLGIFSIFSQHKIQHLSIVTFLFLFLTVFQLATVQVAFASDKYDTVLDNLRKDSDADTSSEALDEFFLPKKKKTSSSATDSTPDHSNSSTTVKTLFDTVEFRGKIKRLPKWSSVMKKMHSWHGYLDDPKTKNLKFIPQWQALTEKVHSLSKKEKIKAVNSYFNQWLYRTDINNYGKKDYWASPPEFLRNSGDCEDYAIAKFYGLKELGFTNEEMRIVAIRDTIRNLAHAVLVVYLDGGALVLDNQTNLLLSHTKYKHYKPAYSVNEKYRWMHVTPIKN